MSFISAYYHIVFHTKDSERTIFEQYERELYQYILGFCNKMNVRLLRIGGMPDHVHMLILLPSTVALSEFVQQLKVSTNKMMHGNPHFTYFKSWQNGFAAFSYSIKDVPTIIDYIKNQKEHHKKVSFRDEYRAWLVENGVSPDEPYFPK